MALDKHLLVHLQHMYVTERDYQMYLCDCAGKARDQQLKSTLSSQIHSTGTEMEALRECLAALGSSPNEDIVSPLVMGLRQERSCGDAGSVRSNSHRYGCPHSAQ